MNVVDEYYNHILSILKESRSDLYSWMNSDGKIYSITAHGKKDHGDLAKYLLSNPNITIDDMFRMGYIRVTHYGDDIYAHNSRIRPNNKQLKSLKDVAIENHMKTIRWDNEDDDIILWYNEGW